jgi:hypothetical protein
MGLYFRVATGNQNVAMSPCNKRMEVQFRVIGVVNEEEPFGFVIPKKVYGVV